jgi:hypothetical protein
VEHHATDEVSRVLPTFRSLVVKTIVAHTVTYFVFGVLALIVFDYARRFAETDLRFLMRPVTDPLVMAGPLLQPIRGLLFGSLLYMLRETFFGTKWGWLRLWLVLLVFGILGAPGPVPGSLEGMTYTTVPLWVQLTGLPEIVLQTLVFSQLLCHWVDHPEKRWLNWLLGVIFAVVNVLPALGLLTGRSGVH